MINCELPRGDRRGGVLGVRIINYIILFKH